MDAADRRVLRERLRELGRDAIPALLDGLKSTDALMRWEAVNLLGELCVAETLDDVLEFALTETERHAAWRALWAIMRFDRGETLPRLLAELDRPPSYRRWRAALALTMFERREAGEILLDALNSPDTWQVWEALSGLRALRYAPAAPRLAGFLDPATPRPLRQQAVLALGSIARRAERDKNADLALRMLKAPLADPHPQVRWRASMTLGAAGLRAHSKTVCGWLRRRLPVETDASVITQLQNDIQRLGGDV